MFVKSLTLMIWRLQIVGDSHITMRVTCLEYIQVSQTLIKEMNSHAEFIPYSTHSPNLVRTYAAEC